MSDTDNYSQLADNYDFVALLDIVKDHKPSSKADTEALVDSLNEALMYCNYDVSYGKIKLDPNDYLPEYLETVHALESLTGTVNYRSRNDYYFMLLQGEAITAPTEKRLEWIEAIASNIAEARAVGNTYEGIVDDEIDQQWELLDYLTETDPRAPAETYEERAACIAAIFELCRENLSEYKLLGGWKRWHQNINTVFESHPDHLEQAEKNAEEFSQHSRAAYAAGQFTAGQFLPQILGTNLSRADFEKKPATVRADMQFWLEETIKEEAGHISFSSDEKNDYREKNLNIVTAETKVTRPETVHKQADRFTNYYAQIDQDNKYIDHAQYLARAVWEARQDWTSFRTLQQAHTEKAKYHLKKNQSAEAETILEKIEPTVKKVEKYVVENQKNASISWHSQILDYFVVLSQVHTDDNEGLDGIMKRRLAIAESGIRVGREHYSFPYQHALICHAHFKKIDDFESCLIRMFIRLYIFVREDMETWLDSDFVTEAPSMETTVAYIKAYQAQPQEGSYYDSYERVTEGLSSLDELSLEELRGELKKFVSIPFGFSRKTR